MDVATARRDKVTMWRSIARGVIKLDRARPRWRVEVNPARLNMADPRNCVVAQTVGYGCVMPWSDGTARLGIAGDTDRYGFSRGPAHNADYGRLQTAWLRMLHGTVTVH